MDVHSLLRGVHIVAGIAGLAAFWVPVFAPKGGMWHTRLGQVFAWSAYTVTLSALVSCAWALLDPIGFAGPDVRGEPQAVAQQIRGLGAFLGSLALAVLASVRQGLLSLRLKRHPQALAAASHRALNGLCLAAGLGLLVYALASRQALYGMLSLVGILTGWGNLTTARRPLPTRMSWWYGHMSGMLGAGIGFHTAALVFGAARFFRIGLEPPLAFIPWLAPTLIGVPAIALWTAYYRRRFEPRRPARVATASPST